jgi:parvulin-like peptidyl-prolyl isomerase
VTIRASAAGRGNDIAPQAMAQLEREVTRRLINIQLLKKLATDEDRAAAAEKAEERVAALVERAGSEEKLVRQLKAVGLTLERLKNKLTEEAVAEVVLERELQIEITEEEIQNYYNENLERFEKPEQVRAAHILIRTRDPRTMQEYPDEEKEKRLRKIKSLQERARNGADFARLVEENTEDERSRSEGGEYVFTRGQMSPAFEVAAFSLEPGGVSDVVTTSVGYHVIKLYEKTPATTLGLDDTSRGDQTVREGIRGYLRARELEEQMPDYVAKLMEESNVEILDERLRLQEGDNMLPDALNP